MSVYTNDFLVKLKRKNYLTPTHYLDFINVYLNLIDEKSTIIARQVIISIQYYKLLVVDTFTSHFLKYFNFNV